MPNSLELKDNSSNWQLTKSVSQEFGHSQNPSPDVAAPHNLPMADE